MRRAKCGASNWWRHGKARASRTPIAWSRACASSSGDLAAGLIKTLVFGLVGIAAQALSVRLIGAVKGLDIGEMLHEEKFSPVVLDVAASYLAFGLIVAAAIL